MGDTPARSGGLLTQEQRDYLESKAGNTDTEVEEEIEASISRDICRGISDFGLVFDYLGRDSLDAVGNECDAEDADFEALFATGYWTLKNNQSDPVSVMEGAIRLAENMVTPLDQAVDVHVSCEIAKEVDEVELVTVLEAIDTGDPLKAMGDLATIGFAEIHRTNADDNSVTVSVTDEFPGSVDDLIETFETKEASRKIDGKDLVFKKISPKKIEFSTTD